MQDICHALHVLYECFVGIRGTGNVRKLDTSRVCIDTSTAALAPEDIYVLLMTVISIHFILNELVAP